MTVDLSDLVGWMNSKENENLEFKEAKNSFEFDELARYCAALANEGGGRIVLGVTDRPPRRVVGTKAFNVLERTKHGLVERLRVRVDCDELEHPDGRVLVFTVPARPIGMPIECKGAYLMRAGESLVPMTSDRLQSIFAETQPDYSAQVCPGAVLGDLEIRAIETFRQGWAQKARRSDLASLEVRQLLEDAELLVDGGVTYAALALLGTQSALGRHLAQAEIVFEYRGDDSSIAYQQRKEYRQGFLNVHDELWSTIGLRNELHSYQEGLFRHDVPAFGEEATREAVMNAVSHRDYRMPGSVFVKQWPARIEITSPGGFPPEITPENILFRQSPRNRRIAEALARCGLVERSGQGADRMFASSLRDGKLPPDYSSSDPHHVVLCLDGRVRDESFLRFLDRLGQETQKNFRVEDLVVLDAVHRAVEVPDVLRVRIPDLIDLGALERAGRSKLVLARRFYEMKGRPGEYTRKKRARPFHPSGAAREAHPRQRHTRRSDG
ncbi:MAG TPA: ATP-binding protein [Polyangiaceae bacterium]|nr:ATP-binding protein [Polyangiaceae bacterium]